MCSQYQFIINILAFVLRVLQWVVPGLLILLITIDIVKIVINPDQKVKSETMTKVVKRIVYAVICFLVPLLVRFVFSTLDKSSPSDYGGGNSYDSSWISCFNSALSKY